MADRFVVKDTFSKMGNFDPIVDEMCEHLLQVKTVDLKILLDFSREWREHVKVSLLMVTGLSLEEAIRECKRYEVRQRVRWDPLSNRKPIHERDTLVERESIISPEEMASRIAEIRYDEDGNDLFENSYLDEYSETFQIQLPKDVIDDVKKGVFEPEKWAFLFTENRSQAVISHRINDDFEMRWQFDTKNRSVLTLKLRISRFGLGLSISIQAEEENRVDDMMYDPVSEYVKIRPFSDGKPFSVSYSSQWVDTWIEDLNEGSLEISDISIPSAKRWEDTYFARIFF